MNAQQRAAFDAVVRGDNIMLSGIAGAGKSYTLQYIIDWAQAHGRLFGLTASTGAAAVLIGGQTLHSFTGIGTGSGSKASLVNRALGRKDIVRRLCALQLLVIDEISMVDAELFDKLSAVFCAVRAGRHDRSRPFGGVQLVLSGDFAQLPPVNGDFCFKAGVWGGLQLQTHDLTVSMRQRDDEFAAILREVRWGHLTGAAKERLGRCAGPVKGDVQPTRLYSTNAAVDKINAGELDELLEGGAHWRQYSSEYSHTGAKTWAKSGRIPETVIMAVGAQVMLTVNLDVAAGLVNGSRGVVIGLDDTGVRVQFLRGPRTVVPYRLRSEENPGTSVLFMPLRLAYALSIHRSQGTTLDSAVVDLKHTFATGMAYVALSRVKSLDALSLHGLTSQSFQCSQEVKDFYGVS